MDQTIIIEKDNNGNINKKVKSELTESFLIVEKGKKLDELDKKEQNAILEQDEYVKYEKTMQYTQKVGFVYKIIRFLLL